MSICLDLWPHLGRRLGLILHFPHLVSVPPGLLSVVTVRVCVVSVLFSVVSVLVCVLTIFMSVRVTVLVGKLTSCSHICVKKPTRPLIGCTRMN